MPLPKPKDDENRAEFISRCMGDENVQNEFDDRDQRLAACGGIFDRSEGKMSVNDRLLKAVGARGQKAEPFAYGIYKADVYVRTLQDDIGLDRCYRFASKGSTSFSDVLEKAARTLTYSNPEMLVEEKGEPKLPEGVELPKNTLMVFRHVLTTSRKDRDGDILHSDGMTVDPKMLLLFQHVHTMPIGKMLAEVEHSSKRLSLVSCIVDINELSHDSAVMVDNGMGRFSHGFRALEFDEIKADQADGGGGFEVKKGEIMEESLVSVPANVDADTEEVLLSLVEGGKLTSPLMKAMGRSIRERRAVSVPVKLDLKVTVNGREVRDDENQPGDRGEEGPEGRPGASKEADGGPEKKKEAGDAEVKGIYIDGLRGSWEWVEQKLREKLKRYLLSVGIDVGEHDWTMVVGTWPDHAIVRVESSSGGEKHYRIEWAMKDDEPEFKGDPAEVKIEVSTEILEKMKRMKDSPDEKAGRVLSKANEAKIADAKEDVDDAAKTDGLARGTKALLRQASGKLGTVLASLSSDKPEGDEKPKPEPPKMVQDAMAIVLIDTTPEQRKTMSRLLTTMEEQEKKDQRLKKFRKFKRSR